MNNTNVKLNYAATLISEKRYREARIILRGVDHPKAREWVARIDAITPRKRPPLRNLFIGLLVVTFITLALVLYLRHVVSMNEGVPGLLTQSAQLTYLSGKCDPADTPQDKALHQKLVALGENILTDPQRFAAIIRPYTQCGVGETFMLYWAYVHMQWSADGKTLSFDYDRAPTDLDAAWHEYKIGWYNS